ncbi:MAG: transposase [Kiritimatiellae bacterium]|nr:transposase [Kiritimatiellia bacterium]
MPLPTMPSLGCSIGSNPTPNRFSKEVEPSLPHSGILVIDDTVLDKPYTQHMGLVSHFRSGKHKRVVKGINLVTCLWTDGDALWPCDYRIVDKAQDKRTKNDHFRELLKEAHQRGLKPK